MLLFISIEGKVEKHGHLGYVFVDPEYSRRGIATNLTIAAMDILRNLGVVRFWAVTEFFNKPAIRILEKLGFKKVDKEYILLTLGNEALKLLMWRFIFIEETDVIYTRPAVD